MKSKMFSSNHVLPGWTATTHGGDDTETPCRDVYRCTWSSDWVDVVSWVIKHLLSILSVYFLMYKMVNAGVLENINGYISIVFHADGGSLEEQPLPDEVLKVFKTTRNEFKNIDCYIKDDYRFSKLNACEIIGLWAEKEMHTLARLKKAEITCPEVVLLKKHILVKSFIRKDHVPAPKLKDATLSSQVMKDAYYQDLHLMEKLYKDCNLVHADLSSAWAS